MSLQKKLAVISACLAFVCIGAIAGNAGTGTVSHAIVLHGEPKYKADFQHLEYVNMDAPKGGNLKLAGVGTFDSLNPFILKGVPASGVSDLVYQTLMTKTLDEASSEYGLIAESAEYPADKSWVAFNIRANAKWSDDVAITADDVVFSFNTLIEKGHPFYRSYFAHVKSAVAENDHRVKFTFDMANNQELPYIMGEMPILPKHLWEGKEFDKETTLTPLGSGPYKVKTFDMGRKIVFERDPNWWGKDLPINRGRYNFDEISYDFFRDETVILQALFAGNYDLRAENIAKAWEAEYDVPPVKEGLIKKEYFHHKLTSGMQGFAFNARRDIFADIATRKALNYTFDFEWSNKQFAYGSYKRTNSYFVNSELASSGVPQGRELEILNEYKDSLPPELFTNEFKLPETDGTGQGMRQNLMRAKELLADAGWVLGSDGVLERDGHKFKFEILLESPAFTRWINPMVENLKKLGIEANLRVVDAAQYQKRMDDFDFDMIVQVFPQSLSPGNEQRDFWSSNKADIQGSRNIIGIKNPVIDSLVDKIVSAPDRTELINYTRALDRVLLWNYYLIPNWYINYYRVAYWDKFGIPAQLPDYGLPVEDTWWYDSAKADNIAKKIKN